MSGPQYANIQTFSTKKNKAGQSIDQIIDEATRDPEFSVHVDAPEPPRVIFGDPKTFRAEHDAHVSARSTSVQMKDGTVRTKTIRKDRHTMASIVVSYPKPFSAITTEAEKAKLAAWEARNVQWLKKTYGRQLRVVMAHEDEEHPHLHAWLLPDDPGADATSLHPGKVAKKAAEAKAKAEGVEPRVAVKIGNGAYRAVMREWQEAYYQAVGAPEGLTRTGPKRRRLTRQQWKAEKEAAKSMAATLGRADEAEARAAELIEQAEAEADQIMKEAEAKAGRINAKAEAVVASVVAMFEEFSAGTIGKKDGKVIAAHPEKIRPGLPEVRPALHAVAAAAQTIKDERKGLMAGQADLAADRAALADEREEVEAEKVTLRGMIDQLKSGLASVLDFIKGPDRTVQEQMEAARLAKRVTPLIGKAKELVEPSPPTEEPDKETGGSGLSL